MTFERKYDFEERKRLLSLNEQKRLTEIKFFLTFKPVYELIDNFDHHKGQYLGNHLMENIANICGVNMSTMKIAFNYINSRSARPTKREIILALRFMGLSYKEIQKNFGISHITVLKYTRQYFEDVNQTLTPVLNNEIHKDLEEILITIQMFFLPIGRICDILYKGRKA